MSFRYPQPSNEDDFELLCLRFLREVWACPTLQRYGKRGERQYGIDLVDEAGGPPLRAVQCKHHEPDKTIPPAEIEAEAGKVFGSDLPVDEYYILTTARKTAQGQNAVIRLNRAHAGRLRVFVWTWADVEERLAQMDDATQDRVVRGDGGRGGPAVCRLIAGVMAEHLDRPLYASASVLDLELEAAKGLIDRHELEVGDSKLREIESRAAGQLQPHHRYQLKALRAKVHIDRWEWDRAGRELLDGKRFQPDSERARVNEALGYELTGDPATAHALATALRAEYPHNVRLLAVWVRTAPADTPFTALAEACEPFVKDDEELNLSLAQQALVAGRYAEASELAARARALDGQSPHAWFLSGQAEHACGYRPTAAPVRARLVEAERCYDRAVGLAQAARMPGLEAAVRLNRAKVRHALGGRADADFLAAAELAVPDAHVRTEYASYLLEHERFADALAELAHGTGPATGARLFYEAAARYGRNAGDDRAVAAALLRRAMAAEPDDRWADAHVLFVQWAVEARLLSEARAVLGDGRLRESDPFVYHTLSGWVADAGEDPAAAREAYRAAVGHLAEDTPRGQVFILAQALAAAGDDEAALPLFDRCHRPGVFTAECRRLLGCAERLGRHDVVARVCRELREAGEADPRIVWTEIQVLQQYDPEEALRVAAGHLATRPGDRHVALWQTALALRLDRPELVLNDPDRLPPVDELTPEGTGLAVHVLAETGHPHAALRYAYDALRAHFDAEFAHGQFVARFLGLSGRCPELDVGGDVRPGTAVRYREDRDDADRWAVIEDGADPELARGEVGPDHPLARALAGRRAGESVVVSDGGIQPRTVTVREVVHRYVYRFRDCLNQFQLRFPGASAIQLVHVGGEGGFDFSPIVRSLEGRRKQIETLDDLYRTQPLPLPAYADLAGRDEFEAWGHLAATPGLGIRCFDGRAEDLRGGVELAGRAKSVVVDLTALWTLANLGLLSVLRTPGRSFLVARSVFERVQHLADLAHEERGTEGSVAVIDGGELGVVQIPREARERHATFLAGLRDAVQGGCRVIPCPRAAALSPKQRNDITQVVGRHTLDSMLLAAEPDHALWTDDLVLGVLGRAEFGAARVWTQPVLNTLRQAGALTASEYDRAVARLVGWHYHGVYWNADTLLAAAEGADWQMDRWPVPQVVRHLGHPAAAAGERLGIAAEAVRAVWRRDLLPHQRHGFLLAVLTGLGSVRLVERLGRAVPRLFGLDVFGAEEARACIGYWLRNPAGVVQP